MLECLDLNSNIRDLFENLEKSGEDKKTIFTSSLLTTTKQIMHKVQRSSDRELTKQGINNYYNASVIALGVCRNHDQMKELDEGMKSTSKELMKMNHGIVQLLNVGLPNLADSNKKFIRKEDYMNLL